MSERKGETNGTKAGSTKAGSTTAGSKSGPTPEAIAKRAYELYLQRGSISGYELEDWLQAEAELRAAAAVVRQRSGSD